MLHGSLNCRICGSPRRSAATEEQTASTLQSVTYNEKDLDANSALSDLDSDVEQYIATDSEARTAFAKNFF